MKKMGFSKSCFAQKAILISISCLLMLTIAVSAAINALACEVQFQDDGLIYNAKIYASTVKDALSETGIDLGEHDEISCDLDSNVRNVPVISIKRAKAVNVNVDGAVETVRSTHETVGDLIDELAILSDGSKLLMTDRETAISENLTISVISVSYEETVETEVIPFETVTRTNSQLPKGTSRVVTEGKNGVKRYVYKVATSCGNEISRELISENIEQEPVNKVIENGTYTAPVVVPAPAVFDSVTASRSGGFRYSRVLNVTATAYDAGFQSTGKRPGDANYGVTATGAQAKRGVIAVDPNVIPLGSRVYVESLDGSPDYGYAVAADTGGAVKGNKIDLCMDSYEECIQFGRRSVRIYILE